MCVDDCCLNHASMADFFKTLKAVSQGIYREKMSRFLAFAEPVATADDARAVIKRYQNQYHDARHVCWAYMIGTAREEFLSSDNGEPSGTAGKPILGQINSFGLTNVVIVVVRYFGGIKPIIHRSVPFGPHTCARPYMRTRGGVRPRSALAP